MASRQARQDRLLERQRGAGRQVKNNDLQLVLPGKHDEPLEARSSGRPRRTPQPDILQQQRSSRRTPASQTQRQLSSRRTPAVQSADAKRSRGRPSLSSKKRPHADPAHPDGSDGPGDAQQPPAKRSKLEHRTNEQELDRNFTPTNGSKKRKKRKSIGQQSRKRARPSNISYNEAEESDRRSDAGSQEELTRDLDDAIQDQLRRENTSLERASASESVPLIFQSIEPTHDTGATPRRKRRKRVSIGQQSRKKPRSNLVQVKEEPQEDDEQMAAETLQQEDDSDSEDRAENQKFHDDGDGDNENADEGGERHVADMSPAAKPARPSIKRRKRKSIGQQRPKKPDKNEPPIARGKSHAKVGRPRKQTNEDGPQARRPESQGRDESEPNAEPRSSQVATTARRLSAPLSRKTRRKNAKAAAKMPVTERPTAGKSTARSIPITVYRPPTPTSPDSSDQDQSGSSKDAAATPKSFNAVDVLAQITLERLSKLAEKLNSQPSTSRTQRKALELYIQEVEARLRQLSEALETNKALAVKVKGLHKEERALKAELKGIEKERSRLKESRADLEERKKRAELEGLLGRIENIARKAWQSQQAESRGGRNEP